MAKVYVSTIVNSPCSKVWEMVRPFDSLSRWHPAISECIIEDGLPSDKVGCVRKLTLADGGIVRETLLGMSDYDRIQTYSILESPMAVENYIASLRTIPITDGDRSFVEWSAEFDCPEDEQKSLEEFISNEVFKSGLAALSKNLNA